MKDYPCNSRILHRHPSFALVVLHMYDTAEYIETNVIHAQIAVSCVRRAVDIVDCGPSDPKVVAHLDAMTLLLMQRAAMQTMVVILKDKGVQKVLPALCIAWLAAREVVSPDEADNILRDPQPEAERAVLRDLRSAWVPVREAAQAALDLARMLDKDRAPTSVR